MKKIIIANWKMNPDSDEEAKKLFNFVKKTKAVICPPFSYLHLFDYNFLCAQDVFWEEKGAFTDNVKYVIVGHSERRAMGETEEIIKKKLKAVLKAGLIPILCVGEKKGQDSKKIVLNQLNSALKGVKNLKKTIIAYEPVWAIGTGNFCSADKANKVRKFIKAKFDNKILYGGSVNSKITADYTKIGFDGLLVGGASLDAKEFIKIVKNAGI